MLITRSYRTVPYPYRQGCNMAGHVFSRAIRRMGLSANTPVAIAVSGGVDSMALTLLARQVFQRVVGITVDHRLHEGSSAEAERTGRLVRQLGLEHHILSLDWEKEGGPLTSSKVQVAARTKRYWALLGLCERLDIRDLMVAHHRDDQIETFLHRFSKGSGVEGLGGMYPISVWSEFPHVNILKPVLELRRAELQEVCQSEGVECVQDASNQSNDLLRNNIRKTLCGNKDLVPGITHLMHTCENARGVLKHQVCQAMEAIKLFVNHHCGFVEVNLEAFRSLPPSIGIRVLRTLALHVGGARFELQYKSLARVYSEVKKDSFKPQQIAQVVLYSPHRSKNLLVVGRAPPSKSSRKLVPISVGETVYWDGRWRITLKTQESKNERRPPSDKREQLYVRHMTDKDFSIARRGIRKVRRSVLPDAIIRGGLPLISNKDGYVVLAPHFQVVDRLYGVRCDIKFDPFLPLMLDSGAHIC